MAIKHYGVRFYEDQDVDPALVFNTLAEGLHCSGYEIDSPEARTYQIDIPGRAGLLDASDMLFGRASFKNRTLTIHLWYEYDLPNDLHTFILGKLHGKKMRIVTDDDPFFYRLGRLHVSTEKASATITEVTITADCGPYKISGDLCGELWLWDPFDFENGIIYKYEDLIVPPAGTLVVDLVGPEISCHPVVLSDKNLSLAIGTKTYSISAGTQKELPEKVSEAEVIQLVFANSGFEAASLSILFREQRF